MVHRMGVGVQLRGRWLQAEELRYCRDLGWVDTSQQQQVANAIHREPSLRCRLVRTSEKTTRSICGKAERRVGLQSRELATHQANANCAS